VLADTICINKLIELCAKVPFDDRINTDAEITDIDPSLVSSFIQETQSSIHQAVSIDLEVYKAMRIVGPFHDTLKPRNVALMLFNSEPNRFFLGAYFEVVQFRDVKGGDLIEENKFRGPIDRQISDVVNYLNNLSTQQLRKMPGKAKVDKVVAFPYEALEEAITNAAYHRGYSGEMEPSKVYLYPDRIEIISYPG
jgi:ATP-dependent DNA helicase RecG